MQGRNVSIDMLKEHAQNIRLKALRMAYECGKSTHLGGGLSIVDALSVLYGDVMNITNKGLDYASRDKFILSKGHGVLGLYATLNEYGIISNDILSTFMKDGSDLIAHPVMNAELGIEASTGSLGQGISMAVGMALAAKMKRYSYNTYVICGNGECNEGSVWEACMFAVSYKLDNFTLFVDNNRMQSDGFSVDVLDVSEKYSDMLASLGFHTIEVDGNSIEELYAAFHEEKQRDKPRAIIGNTEKGKGISFMENNTLWHHNRLTVKQYNNALLEWESL